MSNENDFEDTVRRIMREELAALRDDVLKSVRKEVYAVADRKSFVVAGGWLTTQELTEYAGISRSTIQRLLRDKESGFPAASKLAGMSRFQRSEIDAWLRSNQGK